MPDYFPEANDGKPQDDPLRSSHKWASVLFTQAGAVTVEGLPEGNEPKPQDDLQRLERKIVASLNAI